MFKCSGADLSELEPTIDKLNYTLRDGVYHPNKEVPKPTPPTVIKKKT